MQGKNCKQVISKIQENNLIGTNNAKETILIRLLRDLTVFQSNPCVTLQIYINEY